ncbi:MAG TPA: CPBP family glutamic-type intramembrane protease [Steroidobacteraceae bacterium]|jgi:membrane protease YdiL (CAAX protease family)|nr:CPBP family glutamic-type intramembrane protease [Steroidobacteraceae bacterium]
MALVLSFLVFVLVIAADDLRRRWRLARMVNPPPLARRLPAARLHKVLIAHLVVAAVLVVTFKGGGWNLASVGIRESGNAAEAILAGELAFLALVLLYGLALRALGVSAVMRTAANRGNLRAWPRGRRDKWIAVVCFMVFNPFNEELVMRGILIHQWALSLGSPILPIAVGFALNATMHWYQGARMQTWHALFFATAVFLLYSPWGLAAAITAHVFGDVLPFLALRQNLRRARKERNRKFQAAK